ncbi:MAG: hypothetical protein HDT44_05995 [Ruminococcaceae bacterium]|nr:hypothetical protein [Oscillospiraceae bacterium]
MKRLLLGQGRQAFGLGNACFWDRSDRLSGLETLALGAGQTGFRLPNTCFSSKNVIN